MFTDHVKNYSWWKLLKFKIFGDKVISFGIDDDIFTRLEGYKYKGVLIITNTSQQKIPSDNKVEYGMNVHQYYEDFLNEVADEKHWEMM